LESKDKDSLKKNRNISESERSNLMQANNTLRTEIYKNFGVKQKEKYENTEQFNKMTESIEKMKQATKMYEEICRERKRFLTYNYIQNDP
jgi:hypothetical protein